MTTPHAPAPTHRELLPRGPDQGWRESHAGHWLRLAQQRFDARVLACMAQHPDLPLALAHLAARGPLGAAHVQITRHLALAGMRLSTLAHKAGISKQAMGALVQQCQAWGMLEIEADAHDARARNIRFSATGLAWLKAYQDAVRQAQDELRAAVGDAVCTVLLLGLEAYCSQ